MCSRLPFRWLPLACLALASEAADPTTTMPYERWVVTTPGIFQAGAAGTFDEIAVKDPTIVHHRGRWHLFYTSKPKVGSEEYRTALGYAAADTLEGLRTASRVEMRPILGGSMIAPQIFFFEPQGLWYLLGHVQEDRRLKPVYATNADIGDVAGWSRLQALETNRRDAKRTWIDFWVICDEAKAHLFYSDHTDVLYRMECPLAEFPGGFARAVEEPALRQSGINATGAWNFHEAAHIYRVKSDGRYLALLEGGYPHPVRKGRMDARDARDRFMFAMVADRLEGPWHRVESSDGEFAAEASRLFGPGGGRPAYTQVSHPEILRSGYDQRLEIEDYRITVLFQGFDGFRVPDSYDYNELPWELALMQNVPVEIPVDESPVSPTGDRDKGRSPR